MYRTNTCGELTIKNLGQQVTLCGWLQRSRDLGGMTFIDLRDRYGITQLAFNMETNAALCEQARRLGRPRRGRGSPGGEPSRRRRGCMPRIPGTSCSPLIGRTTARGGSVVHW